MGASRLPHGGEDGQRHGQLQRAREVHHQHRQGSCHIPGEGKADEAPGEGIGHQLIRQIGGLALSLRLHLLRLLDHVNDLVIAALAGGLLYLQHTFALLYHGAGIDRAAGALGYRDGFAGEGRLIDSDLWAVRSQTRSTFSDMHRARSATDFFLVHSSSSSPTSSRNMTIPAVPKSLLQAEMEIDRASSSSTLMRRRSRQRSPLRTKGIMCQRMRAIRREKQGAGGLAHHLCHQLLLKFPVQRPAAVGGQRGGPLRLLPGKMPNFVQHGLASPIVVQDDAAGSLMDGDLPAP